MIANGWGKSALDTAGAVAAAYTVAACAALGAMLIPMMVNSGYNREESAALVASANLVAPITPPSVPMIVYGVSAGVSINSMFMAGIAPAVYLTAIACLVWFFKTRKKGVVPDTENFKAPTPKEALRIFLGGVWALLLPVIILVGLRSGKFTATEAGVIACVYAIIIGLFVYRELKIKDLGKVFVAAAKTSAVVMFLAAAANCAAYFMTVSRIPQMMTAGLGGLVEHPTLLMFVLMCIVVVVGLAMDVTPSILILTPIMLPLVEAAGISPIYFGMCFVLMNVLGLTSPPVGPVLRLFGRQPQQRHCRHCPQALRPHRLCPHPQCEAFPQWRLYRGFSPGLRWGYPHPGHRKGLSRLRL